MKKYLFLFLLLLISVIGWGQGIYLETGKVSSNFKYLNSQGQSLDNLLAVNNNSMAIGYQHKFFSESLNWSFGANYSGYGAIGSINVLNDYLEWDIDYLEFDLGLDFNIFKIKKASVYIKGIVSAGFMLNGTQTVNNTVYNLREVDSFSKALFNLKGGFGFYHPVSKNISLFAQYMYGISSNLETGDVEKLRIRSHSVSFGLLLNFDKKNIDTHSYNERVNTPNSNK